MKHETISIKGMVFPTMVAEFEVEHQQGLMFREWPPPIMTFPYKNSYNRKFWMKNTMSPLDIIFCRGGKVVGICKGEPLSTALVGPNEPSDLVIELPYGTAKKLGLKIGDYVGYSPTKSTSG